MANEFLKRHIGLSKSDTNTMLKTIMAKSLDDMIDKVLPNDITVIDKLDIKKGITEDAVLKEAVYISKHNKLIKSFIGMGYYNTITPSVIRKNILENPGWYSAYTPYQAEISQGRLEMLLNFEHMVEDITGMDIANASLLDEATACAEAVILCWHTSKHHTVNRVFVDINTHPQTISVLTTRTKPLNIKLIISDIKKFTTKDCFAALFSYPNTLGSIIDLTDIISVAKKAGVMTVVTTDLLALTIFKTPYDMGADVAVGSSQRFGVPIGFGGPHAAFLATKMAYKRQVPGRIISVSVDTRGVLSYRMALQTREQHIKRDKANSNICTAQALLAIMAAAYGIYHGGVGLKQIAKRIYKNSQKLAKELLKKGISLASCEFFDTIVLENINAKKLLSNALNGGFNLRFISNTQIGISLDETTNSLDIKKTTKNM